MSRSPTVIFDCHHPKHYLTLRALARRAEHHGVRVVWTLRDKDVTAELARADGFDPFVLTTPSRSLLGLASELVRYDRRLARLARAMGADCLIGNTVSVSHVGCLLRRPSIVINDDDRWTNPQYPLLAYPLATRLILPECMPEDWGRRQRRYRGLHELAYLHPRVFEPDPDIRDELGIGPEDRLFVLRLVGNTASHDVGVQGLSADLIALLIDRLAAVGRVVISSETAVPEPLLRYRLAVPASRFHHVLAAADLVVTDGATVAAEAAVLGVLGVRLTTLAERSYLRMLDRDYGLVRSFPPKAFDTCLATVDEALADPAAKQRWARARGRLLESCVDPTDVFWEELTACLCSRGTPVARAADGKRAETP
jgi:hypothetical protein